MEVLKEEFKGLCSHGNFFETCEACKESGSNRLQPGDYYNASLDQLLEEIKTRKLSIDIEPTFFNGKTYVGGIEVTSAKHIPGAQKRMLLVALHEDDFFKKGISTGDQIKFTSVRGNERQLKFAGRIDKEGIWVETEENGKPSNTPYHFSAVSKYEKNS